MPIQDYFVTAGANNVGGGLFPEGMNAAALNDGMRQLQADARVFYNDPSWIFYGSGSGPKTLVYVSATTFRVPGADVVAVYHPGRRVRAQGNSTGVITGSIISSSFNPPDTTVNVAWDTDSTLRNEPLQIAIGALSASQSAVPRIQATPDPDPDPDPDPQTPRGSLILDNDGDSYINVPADDVVRLVVGGVGYWSIDHPVGRFDLQRPVFLGGNRLTLDADRDTWLDLATDDTIRYFVENVERLTLSRNSAKFNYPVDVSAEGVRFDTDLNTRIRSQVNDDLMFEVGGALKMRMVGAGVNLAAPLNAIAQRVTFDTDGDSYLQAAQNNVLDMVVGATTALRTTNTSMTAFVDLLMAPGKHIKLEGSQLRLDVDENSFLQAISNDLVRLVVGGVTVLEATPSRVTVNGLSTSPNPDPDPGPDPGGDISLAGASVIFDNAGQARARSPSAGDILFTSGGDARLFIHDVGVVVSDTGDSTLPSSSAALMVDSRGNGAGLIAHAKSTAYTGTIIRADATKNGDNTFSFYRATANFDSGANTKFHVRGDGDVFCDGNFAGGGAGFAEMFEWEEKQDDPHVGWSVVLTPDGKIRPAQDPTPTWEIIGVITDRPTIIGNNPVRWPKKFRTDARGNPVIGKGGSPILSGQFKPGQTEDPDLAYVPRKDRPLEWGCVSLLGQEWIHRDTPKGENWVDLGARSGEFERWLIR